MFRDRITNDNNKGFDLLWAGPNATNIPKEAILVESSNKDIQLSNPSQWTNSNDTRFYEFNSWYTDLHGASLKYTFEGVAIWFYGLVDPFLGFHTISLDDSKPERSTSTNATGWLTQQMLWSRVGLTPGQHTFTLTQDDDNGKYVTLNYFRCVVSKFSAMDESKLHHSLLLTRVLRNEDASVLPPSAFTASGESTTLSNNPPASTAPTSSSSSSPRNSSTIPLAVGLSVGLLILGAAILFAFLYRRRSRTVEHEHLPTPTPHFIVPSTTWPVARKQPLPTSNQSMRNQPEAPGLSNSTPNAPGSPRPTLPPSYESHYESGRVHLPQ